MILKQFKLIKKQFPIVLNRFKVDINYVKFPKIWINKADNPNFKHWSIVLRFKHYYIGYQKI